MSGGGIVCIVLSFSFPSFLFAMFPYPPPPDMNFVVQVVRLLPMYRLFPPCLNLKRRGVM